MLKKPISYLLNIGILVSFLTLLIFPLAVSRVLFKGADQGQVSGVVLGSRLSEGFQNHLVYSGSQMLTGRQEHLTASVFPGQVTVYHQAYEVKNESSGERRYQLRWEKDEDCAATPIFHFGRQEDLQSTWLQPNEAAPVHLVLEDSQTTHSSAPYPCDLILTIEAF